MQGTQQQPVAQPITKWQRTAQIGRSFVGLGWYDGLIEFIFRFAAKTSELLLASGIVYSAADILSKGHLGNGNQTIENLWALSQALAIESSGGVVLTYGLTSLRERDTVKAWLYLAMSLLLAITGGIMLFLQFAGYEQSGNSNFMLFLCGLRCFVSVGYIYLCRTKHIRFRDLTHENVNVPSVPASVPTLTQDELTAQLNQFQHSITTSVKALLDEQARLTVPMSSVRELGAQQGGTKQTLIREVREQTEPDLPAVGTTSNQFIQIPTTGEAQARQRLEDAWTLLTDEERQTITGNDFYGRIGRGIRKQTSVDFVREKQAALQEVAV